MCGNGIRCFVKYVYENEILNRDEMLVETLGGIKEVDLDIEGGEVRASSVDMGIPSFKTPDIPMISDQRRIFGFRTNYKDDKPIKITALMLVIPML